MEYVLSFARQRKPNHKALLNLPLEVIPKTRDELRKMKSDREEAERKECIEEVISWLYRRIIETAKQSSDTSYKLQLLAASRENIQMVRQMQNGMYDEHKIYYTGFILEASDEVLQHLRSTFPGCAVEIKTLSKATDGKMYDVSTLDEATLRFVDRRNDQTYLIVDWS